MNYFTLSNLFAFPSLMLCIAISLVQPTLKRKLTVICIYPWLLSPLVVYPAYMERYELPPVLFWLNIALAVSFPALSIWVYRWSNMRIRKIEEMKQRRAERAAHIDGLRYKEDEELA